MRYLPPPAKSQPTSTTLFLLFHRYLGLYTSQQTVVALSLEPLADYEGQSSKVLRRVCCSSSSENSKKAMRVKPVTQSSTMERACRLRDLFPCVITWQLPCTHTIFSVKNFGKMLVLRLITHRISIALKTIFTHQIILFRGYVRPHIQIEGLQTTLITLPSRTVREQLIRTHVHQLMFM